MQKAANLRTVVCSRRSFGQGSGVISKRNRKLSSSDSWRRDGPVHNSVHNLIDGGDCYLSCGKLRTASRRHASLAENWLVLVSKDWDASPGKTPRVISRLRRLVHLAELCDIISNHRHSWVLARPSMVLIRSYSHYSTL